MVLSGGHGAENWLSHLRRLFFSLEFEFHQTTKHCCKCEIHRTRCLRLKIAPFFPTICLSSVHVAICGTQVQYSFGATFSQPLALSRMNRVRDVRYVCTPCFLFAKSMDPPCSPAPAARQGCRSQIPRLACLFLLSLVSHLPTRWTRHAASVPASRQGCCP